MAPQKRRSQGGGEPKPKGKKAAQGQEIKGGSGTSETTAEGNMPMYPNYVFEKWLCLSRKNSNKTLPRCQAKPPGGAQEHRPLLRKRLLSRSPGAKSSF